MITPGDPASTPAAAPRRRRAWAGYAGAVLLCLAAVPVAAVLAPVLDTASLVLVFMLAVVGAAAVFGRGPALLAAGLSVLLFNLAFVPPRLSLSVADERFVFTLAVMLIVGLIVGQLTAGLKAQAHAAGQRERQVFSLYGISRELGQALTVDQVADITEQFVRRHFGTPPVLWMRDLGGRLRLVRGTAAAGLAQRAQAVADGHPGATGDDTVPGALVFPLQGTMAVRGALALAAPGAVAWSAEDRQWLETCAALVGSTLERLHYIEVAQASAVEVEGERLRNSLLSAVSHDLRTPLASLVGLSESLPLTRPSLSPEQVELAGAMAATARRMSAMVDNLLDMARLESGAVSLDFQWQPVEEVIGASVAATAQILPRDRVCVEVEDHLPLVRLDAVLMERVLVNLLENAAKYTPPSAQVVIEAHRQGDAVEMVVRDTGPGLPPQRRGDLFRKFARGERESATPGVGLGLALCRAIVEAHGGHIDAEDAPGGGARFSIILPLGQPPAMPAGDDVMPAVES
ncbi:MAG: DUF4118 domain-containing protein [Ideonella sp.]|nr:DUF4118 domain-containing protein [Ideonella sp.]